MKIKFLKYKTSGTQLNNYFDTAHPNVLTDTLELTHLPLNGFPVFNEEVSARDDFFQYKASDFDIFISYLQNDKSVQGKSIDEFFSGLEDTKILCVFMLGSICRGGFADIASIEKVYNYNDGYGVKVTVIGALKELSEHLRTKELIEYQSSPQYEAFLSGLLSDTGIIGTGGLNYTSRVGFEPILSLPLYNDVRKHTSLDKLNRWIFFTSLAKEHGWAFRLDVQYEPVRFIMNIFWRSEIEDEATIKIIDWKEGFEIPQKKWLFFENRYYNITTGDGFSINVSHGLLMKNAWCRATDTNQQLLYNNVYSNPPFFITYDYAPPSTQYKNYDNIIWFYEAQGGGPNLQIWNRKDEVLETGTEMYDFDLRREYYIYNPLCKLINGSCKVSRMFVKNWQPVGFPGGIYYTDTDALNLQLLLFTEYQFMLGGEKDTVKLKIVNDGNNISLYKKIILTLNNNIRIFWIVRITELDLIERTCEIEAIEI